MNILFDDGSNTTLLQDVLTRRLGLVSQPQILIIAGVSNAIHKVQTEKVSLKVVTQEGSITIIASSIPHIYALVPRDAMSRSPHIADLPLIETGDKVDTVTALVTHT